MRILILTDGIFPFVIGGMQKHAYYMAKHFIKKGADVTIYHCLTNKNVPEDIHEKLVEHLGIHNTNSVKSKCFVFPRLKLQIPGHYVLESYLYSKLLYEELIKEPAFDFIYAKGFSGWYSLNHKKLLPKIGVQFHGLEMFQPSSSFSNYLSKLILRLPVKLNLKKADYIFSYGGKIKQLHLFLGCKEERIVIQHGGVDNSLLISKAFVLIENDKRHFLFIGRNERRKGYSELKRALLKLVDKYDFVFSFIGDIPENERINSDKIHYYGTVSDVKLYFEIIDKHDVIVVPSISEGFPTVIVESMSRALIAIATDVGAVRAAVNKKNGFLIEPGNIEDIENCIIKVINMPNNELLDMKFEALQTITNSFNWENLSSDLVNFITRVK